ncbi:MAG TPA: histidinol-phosphate transaminase [Thermoanaerobaculia bacterium]
MAQLSRRAFAQLIGAATAATALPIPVIARTKSVRAAHSVRLSANENPYGPSDAARRAMIDAIPIACRYPDDAIDALVADLAKLHGVSERQILLGDGSSEILKLSSMAFLSPARPLVVADPTFEALPIAAQGAGVDVRRVPLDASFAHDTVKMLPAAQGAGLVYVCNPNNPTATITPDKSLRAFIAAVPGDTIVLVDEAYHHYATSTGYTSVVDLVATHPNVVVSRTFSKIYGIAGLRIGYAVAQEATIKRLSAQQAWDTVNIMGLVAARASLTDQQHVAHHRLLNNEAKAWLRRQLDQLGYHMLPSDANFVMIDLGKDVKPLIAAMRTNGVEVGRLFPAMPRHLRVTIGTPEEMQRFVDALQKVAEAKKAA